MRHTAPVTAGIACLVLIVLQAQPPILGCSICVLTDGHQAFFANNEDWSNPWPRIWFVPKDQGQYGCVYVGFRNHWAQGGMNTEGLAFDWVAGYKESYQVDPKLKALVGNPSERMLETCAKVDDAIQFYQRFKEPSFSYARILIADKTGASVAVRASGGHLQFDRSKRSRGFGYGGNTLEAALAADPPASPTIANRILRACVQRGTYATKYSNVFDLRSGEIFLCPFPEMGRQVTLGLAKELQKGEHYYDMDRIGEQMGQPPKPWLTAENALAVPDQEPQVTRRIRELLQTTIDGGMRAADFTPEFWSRIGPKREAVQADLKSLGDLLSVILVDRSLSAGKRAYWYQLDFKSAKLLQRFVLDDQERVADIEVEDSKR